MSRNKDLLVTKKNSPMEKAKRLIELQNIMKEIKPEIDALKADLLDVTQKLGVLTLKTDKYTISRAKRVTPQIVNFEELKKSLEAANIPYDTKEVFADHMATTFKKMIEDGNLVAGLEGKETEYISVRIKEE